MAERTTVYDDQADYFDMTNRWISADERKRLAAKEAALLKAKETSVNTLVLDFAGRSVVTTVQTSEESHHKFKEELLAEMKLEDERKKMMDREEAEEHQKAELLRVKGNLKQRADGTVFVLPALDIPAPEFVTRKKEEKAASGAKKPAASSHSSHHSAATVSSSAANSSSASSPSLSLASSAATIPKPASRLQTDFYPEIELDSLDSDSSTTASSKKSSGWPKNSGAGAETDSEISKPVPEVELAPNAVKIRGVVEGFSGKIWTLDDRLDMLTWMAAQGGNFYMWAPVDDPMHRRLWNHLFPDEDVANMRASIQKAKSLGVEFCLGIRPVDFDFRSTHHIDALARKILQAYEKLGCRSFSFIFGDGDRGVPSGCRSLGSAQSELVNTIVNVVDEFLKLKNAPESDGSVVASSSSDSSSATQIRWLICPTVYTSTLESGRQVGLLNYVRELNKALDSRVEILWSGPESPAHSIEKDYLSQMKAFFGEKRRLFFWDRLPSFPAPFDLPVHSADSFDYALHMHQFVEVYERRSPQLSHFFEGALVSTMAAPIPSRVLLSTSLSFFKDPSNYDSKKALIPALQRHVLNPAQNTDSLAASLAALLEISPSTPMSRHQKAPACLNRGDQEERGFFNGLRTHLNKLEKAPDGAFPALVQFTPLINLIKELVSMNLNYYEYLKDPKNAGLVTKSIRDLRASLIPVIFTEHDLTTYRAQLYAHSITDKSFRGDVQRTFTKFRAHHQLGQKDSDAKELEVRLATEATLSLRELEAYLISEYKKEDIMAWRTFLNKLFFRDSTKNFLEKMPSVTSPASVTPNTKVVEARNARMKVKVAEEEKRRVVALKFAIASGTVENPDDSSDDDDEGVPSSSHATSSSTSTSSAATSSPAKKVYRTEVKDLPVPGLRYIRDFLTPEQEAKLLADLDSKEWDGSISRRMQQYGFKFQHRPNDQSEYNTPRLEIAPLMPAFLKAMADELLNGKYMPVKADQVIVNEYTPGQGIRHHVDNPLAFEDVVVSISLGSAALMEFKNSKTDEVVSWLLEPRSLLILTKDARYQWSHSIPPRTEDVWNGIVLGRERRVSVTMRKVKHAVAKELYDAVTKKK
jgi:alkylated DNA repair dioxygenase AlkB